MSEDTTFIWLSRNGHIEAHLLDEQVENVVFSYRRVGADSCGETTSLSKEWFHQLYRLRDVG